MNPFVIYLLIMLENLTCFLIVSGIIMVGICAVSALAMAVDEEIEALKRHWKLWIKKVLITSVVMFFVATFIPSNKQLAMIMGGYIVTNAESVEQIPDNTMKAINKFLSDYVEENVDGK